MANVNPLIQVLHSRLDDLLVLCILKSSRSLIEEREIKVLTDFKKALMYFNGSYENIHLLKRLYKWLQDLEKASEDSITPTGTSIACEKMAKLVSRSLREWNYNEPSH